jgi:hypothetical protein
MPQTSSLTRNSSKSRKHEGDRHDEQQILPNVVRRSEEEGRYGCYKG